MLFDSEQLEQLRRKIGKRLASLSPRQRWLGVPLVLLAAASSATSSPSPPRWSSTSSGCGVAASGVAVAAGFGP
ncbi:hypothetical protein DSM104299_04112 [Baekduia alba]|uniref:hypothetical protein n=1 Tax=Baekduia alba TaxID=2997333 RepID=UPI002341F158|nr:hypothetical protein [Baekduia alba]WCB95369.1 hypothetical protein DSM104299_04112 [Baekduia alba]